MAKIVPLLEIPSQAPAVRQTPEHRADASARVLPDLPSPRWETPADDVHQLEVDLFFAAEMDFYCRCQAWSQASTVLQAECGNGFYLARLQEFFPDRVYTGIDLSGALIGEAQDERENARLAFREADFLSFSARRSFDLIVMRFVIQRFTRLSRVLDQSRALLTAGGALLVIEPELANCSHFPPLPRFEEMLRTLEASRANESRIQTELAHVTDVVARMPGWEIAADESIAVPRVGPFFRTKLVRLYQGWTDLCEQSGAFRFDFAEVRHEIENWEPYPATFSRTSLRVLCLRTHERPLDG